MLRGDSVTQTKLQNVVEQGQCHPIWMRCTGTRQLHNNGMQWLPCLVRLRMVLFSSDILCCSGAKTPRWPSLCMAMAASPTTVGARMNIRERMDAVYSDMILPKSVLACTRQFYFFVNRKHLPHQ